MIDFVESPRSTIEQKPTQWKRKNKLQEDFQSYNLQTYISTYTYSSHTELLPLI